MIPAPHDGSGPATLKFVACYDKVVKKCNVKNYFFFGNVPVLIFMCLIRIRIGVRSKIPDPVAAKKYATDWIRIPPHTGYKNIFFTIN
jgi:hypothetical protein